MRVRVIRDNPANYQERGNKSDLVGYTFEVVEELPFGVVIKVGKSVLVLLNDTEYEIVED